MIGHDLAVDPGHFGFLNRLQRGLAVRAQHDPLGGQERTFATRVDDLRLPVQQVEGGAERQPANDQTAVLTADAAFGRLDDQGTCPRGLLHQQLTGEQANMAAVFPIGHVDGSPGIEQQPGVSIKHHLTALADVGAIVGDPATPCRAMIDQPCRSHCHPKHAHLADEASS